MFIAKGKEFNTIQSHVNAAFSTMTLTESVK